MEVVERYLHAVEFWLPKEQRQDIIAEISEDLQSQIEDRREHLGRDLNEGELEALLKERGRPVLVANRYKPQQFLIGPVLFPVYVFALKICALCYLLPWCAVHVAVYAMQHPGWEWTEAIGPALSSLWTGAFLGAGVITLVFAVLQMTESRTHFLENWDPRKLPPARNPNQIPRAGSVIELVANLSVIAWFSSQASPLEVVNGPSISVWLTPEWAYFLWGFAAVALLNAALAAVNLTRPYWTGWRAFFRMALDGAGAALFCWMLKSNVIAALAIDGVGATRAAEIRRALETWMERAFPFAVIGVVIILGVDVYRIVRVNNSAATSTVWGGAAGLV